MSDRVILLVEDNPDDARLVCEALTDADAGVVVRTSATIAAAWQLLEHAAEDQLPCLVITDHHLPDARGQDLIARMRACPLRANIPLVMVSGDAERPSDLGTLPWFAKPDTWRGWRSLARELVAPSRQRAR